ncbi:MAG TPA: hypothetical protein VEF92_04500 [Burkholderiales bacterium]|nr:hypothetical protein [Burkholderiales bacterium]
MTKHRRANGRARPIKTKRDYEGASSVAKQLSGRADRDSVAELRLKALLHELDKYEDSEEDAEVPGGEDYLGPRRRWSDDASED